jgi:hypothetical protein
LYGLQLTRGARHRAAQPRGHVGRAHRQKAARDVHAVVGGKSKRNAEEGDGHAVDALADELHHTDELEDCGHDAHEHQRVRDQVCKQQHDDDGDHRHAESDVRDRLAADARVLLDVEKQALYAKACVPSGGTIASTVPRADLSASTCARAPTSTFGCWILARRQRRAGRRCAGRRSNAQKRGSHRQASLQAQQRCACLHEHTSVAPASAWSPSLYSVLMLASKEERARERFGADDPPDLAPDSADASTEPGPSVLRSQSSGSFGVARTASRVAHGHFVGA